jgi:hypothetical protein
MPASTVSAPFLVRPTPMGHVNAVVDAGDVVMTLSQLLRRHFVPESCI